MFPDFGKLTEDEKGEIVNISRKIMTLSWTARREGILSLEESLENISDSVTKKNARFLEILVKAVIDGWDKEFIVCIADNYIGNSCRNDFEKFSFMLIKEGILGIQNATNPWCLSQIFSSLMGIDNYDEYNKLCDFDSLASDIM